MGLLKKIFKPVSKVLDKIVPNEIKPLLPYAAAFAPYMLGTGSGLAGASTWQKLLYNPYTRGGIMGGLNIGSQLAQEGSEGDINLLSAGLASLQGAMTSPGFSEKIDIMRGVHPSQEFEMLKSPPKFIDKGLEYLGKGSDVLSGMGETLRNKPFSVEGLKAATIPFTQGTGDLMYAQGQRDLKDLANQVVDEMGGGYTDDAYRAAIRKSMTAYGATEEEIEEAIIAAGYRSGGRVGLLRGGDPDDAPEQEDVSIFELQKGEGVPIGPQVQADKQQLLLKAFADYKKGGGTLSFKQFSALWMRENVAQGGRVGLEFGGIPQALQAVEEKETEWITKKGDVEIMNKIFSKSGWDGVNMYIEQNPELKDKYVDIYPDYDSKEIKAIPNELYNIDSMDGINTFTVGDGIEFIMPTEKANGGRVGMWSGGGLKSLWNLGKGMLKGGDDAVDLAKQEKLFRSGPISADFLENVDDSMIQKFIRTRDTAGEGGYGLYKSFDEMPAGLQAAEFISRVKKADGGINYEVAEIMIGKKLKGNESIDELLEMIIKPQKIKKALGGRINKAEGGTPSVLPKGIEADYRGGGFIPIGSKERADDVPARLSENEFVMTADAVRAAGGGNVNKGAQRMYNVMNQLEARA
jgi:hypothetical protein